MAKDKKSAAQKAAEAAAAAQKPQTESPAVMNQMGKIKQGLSPDATVIALNGLKEMVHDNPNAAQYYGMSNEQVMKINQFTLAGFATVLAIEVEENKSPFAVKMLEMQPEAINAISEFTGVHINTKALPAPNEKGEIEVPSHAIEVSEEAKKKIKAEKEIEKKNPTTNPAEIENEEQLSASLSNLLTKGQENVDARIKKVINFYRGYLTIQANKAENKEEALAKVKEMTRSQMLEEITNIVGNCPFALTGFGKLFRNHFIKSGTVVSPFCMYRRTSIDTAKDPVDDAFVADVVKILINWSCKSVIANAERTIAEADRIIKKYNKTIEENKDANDVAIAKAGIPTWEGQKKQQETIIADAKATLEKFNNPSLDEVDMLIENYNGSDDTKEEYKHAHLIVDNIIKTYYKDVDQTKVDKDVLLKNVQQRAGIIVNMFRGSLSQSIAYKESNITELVEKPAEETKE